MSEPVSNTLEKELARLYRLGKTPVDYISTLSTLVVMLLYLNKKYGLEDSSISKIKENYRQYGRLTKRQKVLMKPPEYYSWELYLYYDKNDRLIGSNRDDYYAGFYWKLRDKIEANQGKKIFCTFDITYYKNDIPDNGHIELVIYDPEKNTLEHVNSNYLPKHVTRKEASYFESCEIIESILREVADALPTVPKYINNNDFYGGYDYGIQSMEAASDLLTPHEKEGLCLMWTCLFAELAVQFPQQSMKEIITAILHKSKLKTIKVDYSNDYFLILIRGYIVDVSRQLNIQFTDETSLHSICTELSNF